MSTTTADDARTNSRIVTAYRQRTAGSAELARQAQDLFPSGITHDARNLDPYGIGWMLVVRPAPTDWKAALVSGDAIGPAFEAWMQIDVGRP